MKILYVEDNPANLFLVKRVARVGGHEVINYIDGEEALANYEKDNPDLVLMDIQLAGELTGLQVVERLRARGHKTPIIAVTAYAMIGDRERCLAAGCDDYIAKPLPIPRLVEILEKFSGGIGAPKPATSTDTQTVRVVMTSTSTSPAVASSTQDTPKVETKPEQPAASPTTDAPKTEAKPEQPAAPSTTADTPKTETKPEQPANSAAPTPEAKPQVEVKAEVKEKVAEVPALKLNTISEMTEDEETQVMPMVNPIDALDDSPKKEA